MLTCSPWPRPKRYIGPKTRRWQGLLCVTQHSRTHTHTHMLELHLFAIWTLRHLRQKAGKGHSHSSSNRNPGKAQTRLLSLTQPHAQWPSLSRSHSQSLPRHLALSRSVCLFSASREFIHVELRKFVINALCHYAYVAQL